LVSGNKIAILPEAVGAAVVAAAVVAAAVAASVVAAATVSVGVAVAVVAQAVSAKAATNNTLTTTSKFFFILHSPDLYEQKSFSLNANYNWTMYPFSGHLLSNKKRLPIAGKPFSTR
jgi:hypothetical protein